MIEQDPRARLKSFVRTFPWLSSVLQWLLDPAFTPGYLISRWVGRQRGCLLNFGSGSRSLGARVVNLDIDESAHVHVVNRSEGVPFADESFEAVLLEYVLEHVGPIESLLDEVVRVLKPGGSVLITVPFRQSYHACPQDFWRFTHEGLERLLRRHGLDDVHVEVYGGPTSAWIDATKEFLATICSFGSPLLYALWSQAFIVPFIPLRYLDLLLRHLPVAKYTAFSFMAVAIKPGALVVEQDSAQGLSIAIERKIERALRVPEGFCVERRDGRFFVEPAVLEPTVNETAAV